MTVPEILSYVNAIKRKRYFHKLIFYFVYAIFNTCDKNSEIEIPLTDLEIYDKIFGTELWSGKEVSAENTLKVKLESHGAKAYFFK